MVTDTPLVDYAVSDSGFDPFTKRSVDKTKKQSAPKKTTPLPPWREGAIAQWAGQIYQLAGGFIVTVDPICGNVLINVSEPAGIAWEKLAKQNNAVRRLFGYLMAGSTISEVVMAHLPLAAAILTHHGPFALPLETMGEQFKNQFEEALAEQNAA